MPNSTEALVVILHELPAKSTAYFVAHCDKKPTL